MAGLVAGDLRVSLIVYAVGVVVTLLVSSHAPPSLPVPDHASAPGPDPSVNSDLTLPLNLSSQVVVPAWPAFNRHPVRWRSSLLASGDVVDSKKTQ